MAQITQDHAVKRITQITQICYRFFDEEEKEAKQIVLDAKKEGFEVEERPIVIHSTDPNSIYWNWHELIRFYSTFL